LGLVVPAARQALWWVVQAASQVLAPINMAVAVAVVLAVRRQQLLVVAGRRGLSMGRVAQVVARQQGHHSSLVPAAVVALSELSVVLRALAVAAAVQPLLALPLGAEMHQAEVMAAAEVAVVLLLLAVQPPLVALAAVQSCQENTLLHPPGQCHLPVVLLLCRPQLILFRWFTARALLAVGVALALEQMEEWAGLVLGTALLAVVVAREIPPQQRLAVTVAMVLPALLLLWSGRHERPTRSSSLLYHHQ
jgi:hypothetical protein